MEDDFVSDKRIVSSLSWWVSLECLYGGKRTQDPSWGVISDTGLFAAGVKSKSHPYLTLVWLRKLRFASIPSVLPRMMCCWLNDKCLLLLVPMRAFGEIDQSNLDWNERAIVWAFSNFWNVVSSGYWNKSFPLMFLLADAKKGGSWGKSTKSVCLLSILALPECCERA